MSAPFQSGVSASKIASHLLENEDVDWTQDADDDADAEAQRSNTLNTLLMPVGFVVALGLTPINALYDQRKVYFSAYPEWDDSYTTTNLNRAKIYKIRSTIDRLWAKLTHRVIPVYRNAEGIIVTEL